MADNGSGQALQGMGRAGLPIVCLDDLVILAKRGRDTLYTQDRHVPEKVSWYTVAASGNAERVEHIGPAGVRQGIVADASHGRFKPLIECRGYPGFVFVGRCRPTEWIAQQTTPDMSQIITAYGPWAIFALVLFEDFGLFFVPGETALITAALLASQGHMSIEWLLLAAWVGAVLGDNIGYCIGRFGGRRLVLRYGTRFGATHERLLRVEQFFARYGSFIVVFARFFFGLRQLNGIVAGIGMLAAPLFVLYNAIGAALWVGVWGFCVYLFGHHFTNLIHNHLGSMSQVVIYALIGLAVVVLVGFFWWRRRHASRAE